MPASSTPARSEGVERNTHLRALALDNRSRLDESSKSLVGLSGDVEASAAAIEQLAQASEEVRTFVTLVQKLARQSKLLALNAAMEAARAGEHGHGFAVVAEEVRRLAAMSSDAAERTERVVSGVLTRRRAVARVERAHGGNGARGARGDRTRLARRSERSRRRWPKRTAGPRRSSAPRLRRTALVHEMQQKLDSMAAGTDSFAAAMEEVAASSEEQSASTEEIAAAAATLSGAAERLSRLVANLRLDEAPSQTPRRRRTSESARPRRTAGAGLQLAPTGRPVTA